MTWVSKKPSDAHDRNQVILSRVNENLADDDQLEIVQLLECPNDFETQKTQTTFTEKRQNVDGKFALLDEVEGREIILFDDIYTSGSTLRECAKVFRDAGASQVVGVTLGVTCHESQSTVPPLTCSGCGTALIIRFRNEGGNPFWACPKWGSNDGKSHPGVDFKAGINQIRQMQSKIEADRFPF